MSGRIALLLILVTTLSLNVPAFAGRGLAMGGSGARGFSFGGGHSLFTPHRSSMPTQSSAPAMVRQSPVYSPMQTSALRSSPMSMMSRQSYTPPQTYVPQRQMYAPSRTYTPQNMNSVGQNGSQTRQFNNPYQHNVMQNQRNIMQNQRNIAVNQQNINGYRQSIYQQRGQFINSNQSNMARNEHAIRSDQKNIGANQNLINSKEQ